MRGGMSNWLVRVRQVLALGVGLCLVASAGFADGPKVVVTIKPVHALVAEVMRGVATPELLVKGQASPHTYALKPSETRLLHAADVFIRVADTVEPFAVKLSASLPASVTVVTLQDVPSLHRLPRRHGANFSSHDHAHDHSHDDDRAASDTTDGHVWLDPANARAVAAHVEGVLAARFPAFAQMLRANREALDARLTALDNELRTELTPLVGKPYVVFHDAYQYFERRYNLNAVGAIFVSPDIPPSGKRLRTLRRQIATLQATCVFGEPQSDQRMLQTVVEGSNARTGVLDAEGLDLEPGPDLYFQLMRGLARSMRACLTPGA